MNRLLNCMKLFGIDFYRMGTAFYELPHYLSTKREFRRKDAFSSCCQFKWGKLVPCLNDRCDTSGVGRGAYFYQDLLVARKIFENAPIRHIDVGSRIDGFVAHVASFRDIEVIDIRPLPDDIPHVHFERADMMNDLPEGLTACCDSVSCLHALEHFGLGRYNDPIDPEGWRKGFDNLSKMLQKGGRLYLSVPLSKEQRVNFNGHRVFSLPFLMGVFDTSWRIESVSVIDDDGHLNYHIDWQGEDAMRSFDLRHGCAIIEAIKCKI